MKLFEKIPAQTYHTFTWHPVSEAPKNLKEPVLFLTNRGALVTHSTLLARDGHSLYSRRSAYANAIAWCYQRDLIPNIE